MINYKKTEEVQEWSLQRKLQIVVIKVSRQYVFYFPQNMSRQIVPRKADVFSVRMYKQCTNSLCKYMSSCEKWKRCTLSLVS